MRLTAGVCHLFVLAGVQGDPLLPPPARMPMIQMCPEPQREVRLQGFFQLRGSPLLHSPECGVRPPRERHAARWGARSLPKGPLGAGESVWGLPTPQPVPPGSSRPRFCASCCRPQQLPPGLCAQPERDPQTQRRVGASRGQQRCLVSRAGHRSRHRPLEKATRFSPRALGHFISHEQESVPDSGVSESEKSMVTSPVSG